MVSNSNTSRVSGMFQTLACAAGAAGVYMAYNMEFDESNSGAFNGLNAYAPVALGALTLGVAFEIFKKFKNEPEPVAPQPQGIAAQAGSAYLTSIPYVGGIVGTVGGFVGKYLNGGNVHEKDSTLCKCAAAVEGVFGQGPCVELKKQVGREEFLTCPQQFETDYFVGINDAKQAEISGRLPLGKLGINHKALRNIKVPGVPVITPYLPLLITPFARTIASIPSEGILGTPKKFVKEIASIPGNQIIHSTAVYGTSLFATGLIAGNAAAFTEMGLEGFDPSGHVMAKIALGTALGTSIDYVRGKGSKTALALTTLFATTIAATDAVMMYNTAGNCHTLAEVAAGVALSTLVVYPIAATVTEGFDVITSGAAAVARKVANLGKLFFSPQVTDGKKEAQENEEEEKQRIRDDKGKEKEVKSKDKEKEKEKEKETDRSNRKEVDSRNVKGKTNGRKYRKRRKGNNSRIN